MLLNVSTFFRIRQYSIKEKEGTIINSVREDYFTAYAKAELNDQSVWLIGNRCLKNNSNIPNKKKTLCQMAVLYCCVMVEKVENAAIMQ